MGTALEGIKAVFLDLDGTIYLGGQLIPGALDFLNRCDEQGVKRFFLSNNSSRSVDQYVKKLEPMGIPATPEDVLLSTHDCIAWLKRNNIAETYCVGTEACARCLRQKESQPALHNHNTLFLAMILRQPTNDWKLQVCSFMLGFH